MELFAPGLAGIDRPDRRRRVVGDLLDMASGIDVPENYNPWGPFTGAARLLLTTDLPGYLAEHREGTFAQYVTVPARNALPLPEGWSFAEGAALGVNHLTAWRMLVTQARLKAWETVLVFGIGGGVSLAGLQIAKALGARVIVTSRDDTKLARALQLGADHAVNSATQDVAKAVQSLTGGRGVDVVFENVGEAVWPAAMKSLVRGGRLVTCGATSGDQPGADLRRLFIRQLQVIGSTLGTLGELHDLLGFCQQQGLRPVIEQTFPLDEVHAALSRLESGQQFGKIALAIDGSP